MWAQYDESYNASQLPGGDYYTDITGLVNAAADEMHTGDLLMNQGFTLMDAMSAIEIMDPRLDSHLATHPNADASAAFNVFQPLTPEELCWVMDRCICAEMTWHAGRALSQTVYSCLYFQEFSNLDPVIWHTFGGSGPSPLMTSVLRSWIQCMIKTCDMAWREFAQRHVFENEDVITDKSELSLFEVTRTDVALDNLDAATMWLNNTEDFPWCSELCLRLDLRRSLLRIFAHHPRSDPSLWISLIRESQDLLTVIRSRRHPEPHSAIGAFDPAICRKLVNHAPLPVIKLMEIDEAWDKLEEMLKGLEEIASLERSQDLLLWKTSLNVLAREERFVRRSAYVRSRTSTSFLPHQLKVFGEHPREWVVDEILYAIANIPPRTWDGLEGGGGWSALLSNRAALGTRIWNSFRGMFSDRLIVYYKSLSNNRPRQRRSLSKNMSYWREMYQFALRLPLQLNDYSEVTELAERVPLVVMHLRLEQIAEIVLSGFESELHSANETPFLYWYLSRTVFAKQLEVLDHLAAILVFPASSPVTRASRYIETQISLVSALRSMTEATFLSSVAHSQAVSPPKAVMSRRLEWAYQAPIVMPDVNAAVRDIDAPSIERFADDVAHLSGNELESQQLDLWSKASGSLTLLRNREGKPSLTRDALPAYEDFLEALNRVCLARISRLGASSSEPPSSSPVQATVMHPWFPAVI